MSTGFLARGYNGRGVKLTIRLHIAPILRMSGAIPVLPLSPWAKNAAPVVYISHLTAVVIKEFRFAVTAAVHLNSSVFWVVTRREVVSNRRFGTAYLSHL